MAIGPFQNVSTLSIDHLYDLYFAIAQSDHAFRIKSLYGDTKPPVGHCEFRPLTRESFTQRVLHYDSLEEGAIGQSLRQRLARQACAYGVSCQDIQSSARRAA